MGFRLTKKEVETLGNRFAEMLLFSKEANPGILPDLVSRKDWKSAEFYERKQAIADIARQARADFVGVRIQQRACYKENRKNLSVTKEKNT